MQVDYPGGVNVSGTWEEVGLLAIEVDVCDDSIIPLTLRKSSDGIYSDDSPGTSWNL